MGIQIKNYCEDDTFIVNHGLLISMTHFLVNKTASAHMTNLETCVLFLIYIKWWGPLLAWFDFNPSMDK